MQWCQRLDADHGMDPWIWQSLHGPSFHLSSKLCLCNSFHGCFVPNSKKGQTVHTLVFLVFVLLEFHVFCKLYLVSWVWQSLDGPSFHLSSKFCLCNSFHGCFVPNSKKGQSDHTLVFILLEFYVF